jgi:hypothetical protein
MLPRECLVCGGECRVLGALGRLVHFQCRSCGLEFASEGTFDDLVERDNEDELSDEEEDEPDDEDDEDERMPPQSWRAWARSSPTRATVWTFALAISTTPRHRGIASTMPSSVP